MFFFVWILLLIFGNVRCAEAFIPRRKFGVNAQNLPSQSSGSLETSRHATSFSGSSLDSGQGTRSNISQPESYHNHNSSEGSEDPPDSSVLEPRELFGSAFDEEDEHLSFLSHCAEEIRAHLADAPANFTTSTLSKDNVRRLIMDAPRGEQSKVVDILAGTYKNATGRHVRRFDTNAHHVDVFFGDEKPQRVTLANKELSFRALPAGRWIYKELPKDLRERLSKSGLNVGLESVVCFRSRARQLSGPIGRGKSLGDRLISGRLFSGKRVVIELSSGHVHWDDWQKKVWATAPGGDFMTIWDVPDDPISEARTKSVFHSEVWRVAHEAYDAMASDSNTKKSVGQKVRDAQSVLACPAVAASTAPSLSSLSSSAEDMLSADLISELGDPSDSEDSNFLVDFDEHNAKELTSEIISNARRLPVCTTLRTKLCDRKNHIEHRSGCEVCAVAGGRFLPHRRVGKAKRLAGQIAVDIMSIGMSGPYMLVASHIKAPNIVTVARSSGKDGKSVYQALMSCILDMEHRWKTCLISRVHSDGEKGLEQKERDLCGHGIKLTSTGGNNPRANGTAERMVGILSEMARQRVNHLEVHTRRLVYAAAVRHAADAYSIKQLEALDPDRLPEKYTLYPFGCKVLAFDPNPNTRRYEDKVQPAMYLGMDPKVSNGHHVRFETGGVDVDGGPFVQRNRATSVNVKYSRGILQPHNKPNYKSVLAQADVKGHAQYKECDTCGKTRLVNRRSCNALKGTAFICSRLRHPNENGRGLKCDDVDFSDRTMLSINLGRRARLPAAKAKAKASSRSTPPTAPGLQLQAEGQAHLSVKCALNRGEIYGIGHSDLSWDNFTAHLLACGVQHIVDVRTNPSSKRFPDYDLAVMKRRLKQIGIKYLSRPTLGGSHGHPPRSVKNRVHANLASQAGQSALREVAALAKRSVTVMLCSESSAKRCHRSVVADALLKFHNVPFHDIQPPSMTCAWSEGSTKSPGKCVSIRTNIGKREEILDKCTSWDLAKVRQRFQGEKILDIVLRNGDVFPVAEMKYKAGEARSVREEKRHRWSKAYAVRLAGKHALCFATVETSQQKRTIQGDSKDDLVKHKDRNLDLEQERRETDCFEAAFQGGLIGAPPKRDRDFNGRMTCGGCGGENCLPFGGCTFHYPISCDDDNCVHRGKDLGYPQACGRGSLRGAGIDTRKHGDHATYLLRAAKALERTDHEMDAANATEEAYLTYDRQGDERNAPGAVEARKKELHKVIEKFEAYDQVMEMGDVHAAEAAKATSAGKGHVPATWSGSMCLSSIKHYEKAPELQKEKGRLVVWGHKIFIIKDDPKGKHSIMGDYDRAELWSAVCDLNAARTVIAKAAQNPNQELESLDITNAYLQIPYEGDEKFGEHWVKFDKDTIANMPEGPLKTRALSMRNPIFRMAKACYGHPRSGKLFIESVRDLLLKDGWTQCSHDPALFHKGDAAVATYVDDLLAAGSRAHLDQLWALIYGRFVCEEKAASCEDFIGIQIRKVDFHGQRAFEVHMEEYSETIARIWEKGTDEQECLFGAQSDHCIPLPRSAPSPLYTDIRPGVDTPSFVPKYLVKIQKVIGMLLWVARCARPDIMASVSFLAARTTKWSPQMDRELARCVRYVQQTSKAYLRYAQVTTDDPDTLPNLELNTDADLHHPRSQSGWCGIIRSPTDPDDTFDNRMTLAWGSKKQAISADSTAAAETIAGHYGIKQFLPAIDELHLIIFGQPCETPTAVRNDNAAVVRSRIRRLEAKKVGVYEKALGLKAELVNGLQSLKIISMTYIKSSENPSDLMTKRLTAPVHLRACEIIGLHLERCSAINVAQTAASTAHVAETLGSTHSIPQQPRLFPQRTNKVVRRDMRRKLVKSVRPKPREFSPKAEAADEKSVVKPKRRGRGGSRVWRHFRMLSPVVFVCRCAVMFVPSCECSWRPFRTLSPDAFLNFCHTSLEENAGTNLFGSNTFLNRIKTKCQNTYIHNNA